MTERYTTKQLSRTDTAAAAALDALWFEHSAEADDIDIQRSVGIFSPDGTLKGFATYEIIENGTLPTDYIGNVSYQGRIMFVQQFTTDTNYKIGDTRTDSLLLAEVEKKARELGCNEVWEALAVRHPYRRALNSAFDAYGFYRSKAYSIDRAQSLTWHPQGSAIHIPCTTLRKKIGR